MSWSAGRIYYREVWWDALYNSFPLLLSNGISPFNYIRFQVTVWSNIWSCATIYEHVPLYMSMCHYIWACATIYEHVPLSMSMCHYIWACATIYEHVPQHMNMCHNIWACVTKMKHNYQIRTLHFRRYILFIHNSFVWNEAFPCKKPEHSFETK